MQGFEGLFFDSAEVFSTHWVNPGEMFQRVNGATDAKSALDDIRLQLAQAERNGFERPVRVLLVRRICFAVIENSGLDGFVGVRKRPIQADDPVSIRQAVSDTVRRELCLAGDTTDVLIGRILAITA